MTACPHCGNSATEPHHVPELGAIMICGACATFFEPETRADPTRQTCNDCAFRPGSKERSDAWKWAEIVEVTIVEGRHAFHCHKGLACRLEDDQSGYAYLMPPEGPAAMTPCAGWRATKAAFDAGAITWRDLTRKGEQP